MTKQELRGKKFEEAAALLEAESDLVTTRQSLIEFVLYNITEERFFLAIHILSALNECPADYYSYDYCMGTLETPTPLATIEDLEDYCEN